MFSASEHKSLWSRIRTCTALLRNAPVFSSELRHLFVSRFQSEVLSGSYSVGDALRSASFSSCGFVSSSACADAIHFFDSLVLDDLIYPPPFSTVLQSIGIALDDNLVDIKFKLGYRKRLKKTDDHDALDVYLKVTADNALQHRWSFRLGQACIQYKDWYPFFITLTVDPKIIEPNDLWQNTDKWQQYVKRLGDISMRACGLSNKQRKIASVRDYLQYAAVIEHGKSGVHAHVHALVFFRDIPGLWKIDPNKYKVGRQCTNNLCLELQNYWYYGKNEAAYFRYIGDVWQTLGHKVSYSKKTGKTLLTCPELSGQYLVKYLTKGDKTWKHRVKATRGLGTDKLKSVLNSLTTDHLTQLVQLPPSLDHLVSFQRKTCLPRSLVTSISRTLIYNRTYRQLTPFDLMEPKPSCYLKMLSSVENGVRPWRFNSTVFYQWLLDCVPPAVDYSDSLYNEAVEALSVFYFQPVVLKPLQGI